jgi:hypothetical protein
MKLKGGFNDIISVCLKFASLGKVCKSDSIMGFNSRSQCGQLRKKWYGIKKKLATRTDKISIKSREIILTDP